MVIKSICIYSLSSFAQHFSSLKNILSDECRDTLMVELCIQMLMNEGWKLILSVCHINVLFSDNYAYGKKKCS